MPTLFSLKQFTPLTKFVNINTPQKPALYIVIDEDESKESLAARKSFSTFLRAYIMDYSLQSPLLSKMMGILVSHTLMLMHSHY